MAHIKVDPQIQQIRDYIQDLEKVVNTHLQEEVIKDQAGDIFLSQYPESFFHKTFDQRQGMNDRYVCVMFTDLVGFTALLENHGTREISELLNHYFNEMDKIIHKYDGWIHKFNGDGMVVLFGLMEDTQGIEEKAVKAALQMQESMENKFTSPYGLQMRVSIEAGRVIFDEIRTKHTRRFDCLGRVINVASRLEQYAKNGGIILGPQLSSVVVKKNDLPVSFKAEKLELKGIKNPVTCYHVFTKK